MEIRKPYGYWTRKRIIEEAQRYSYRGEFCKHSSSAYQIACRRNIIDSVCAHMRPMAENSQRSLYVLNFADGSKYVGLTNNMKRRMQEHRTKFGDTFVELEVGLFEFMDAPLAEANKVAKLKECGVIVRNSAKAGSLGKIHKKWTKKSLLKLARNYKTMPTFKKENAGAYATASKHGMLKELKAVLKAGRKSNGYWTEKRIIELARNCETKWEFRQKYPSAYAISTQKGFYNKACMHMPRRAVK